MSTRLPILLLGEAVNKKQMESIITTHLKTSKGRSKLAQSMMAPIRQRMNYSGLARRLFAVLCPLCYNTILEGGIHYVNIRLEKMVILNKAYSLCSECLKDTKKQIKKITKGPPEELPLYINDKNIFIREHATKRLKSQ